MINVQPVANIIEAFPVGLYAKQNVLSPQENDIVLQKIYKMQSALGAGNTRDWLSGDRSPDNCFHISNLTEYLEFMPLIDRVRQCVNELASAYGSDEDHTCAEAWYNIYNGSKYQEFHMHPNNIFSAVYFAKVPDGAQGIYFKRPDNGSMLPPKNKTRDTRFNQDILIAPPEERTVIVFRANLQHSVPPTTLHSDRVTVALNFQ
tara:strand:+ start:18 stop:629 length:612 start_codon:yes stop_codon:yes gene_type:complete